MRSKVPRSRYLPGRACQTYKTYRNRQKVEEVQREVLSVLKVVAEIKVQVKAGRELTDREFRLTRELLDVHSRRLDDRLEPRVDDLEVSNARRDRAGREWVRFNRVCKEAERVWRPSLGKCIHVSIAGLRR